MRVFLCIPPDKRLERFPLWMPLGIAYLGAGLRNRFGESVKIAFADCPALGWDTERLVDEIGNFNPDVVGFSFMSLSSGNCARTAAAVRRALPRVVLVAGGPHVTGDPFGGLEMLPDVDAAIRGEADESFPLLVEAVGNGWLPWDGSGGKTASGQSTHAPPIQGLVLRRPGGKITSSPPAFVQNLDSLPLPDWNLIHPEMYPTKTFFSSDSREAGPIALIATTRGCPWDCTFCQGGRSSGISYRKRTPENILKELETLYKNHGIHRFMLSDDSFSVDRKYALKLCRKIVDLDFKPSWTIMNGLRPDTVDEELLKAMYEAGCKSCHFGIETASDPMRKNLGKNFKWQRVRKTVNTAKKTGLETGGFFMIGFPGETFRIRIQTILGAATLKLDRAVFLPFAAFPGSPITQQAVNLGYKPTWTGREPPLPPAEEGMKTVGFLHRNSTKEKKATIAAPLTPSSLSWWLRISYVLFYLRPYRFIRILRELHHRGGMTGALKYVWHYLSD